MFQCFSNFFFLGSIRTYMRHSGFPSLDFIHVQTLTFTKKDEIIHWPWTTYISGFKWSISQFVWYRQHHKSTDSLKFASINSLLHFNIYVTPADEMLTVGPWTQSNVLFLYHLWHSKQKITFQSSSLSAALSYSRYSIPKYCIQFDTWQGLHALQILRSMERKGLPYITAEGYIH